jgi:dipeptidase E
MELLTRKTILTAYTVPSIKNLDFCVNILMLSSSREGNEPYLASARPTILEHLGGTKRVLFVPYAGVSLNWDDYTEKVQAALPELHIHSIHNSRNTQNAVNEASAIMIGGGNTFNLLYTLYRENILDEIRNKVLLGTHYIGWSAGSNICGDSIRTTNDMPIVQPPSFDALGLVPFQINPHYSDYHPPGFNGETRAQRISEFCTLNPEMPVVGIREGTALILNKQGLRLLGPKDGIVFCGNERHIIKPHQDLSDMLNP